MPNQLAHLVLAPTTAAASLVVTEIPASTTQGNVVCEGTVPIRVKFNGVAAVTGASGGTRLDPGESMRFAGNNYGNNYWQLLSAVGLTDGGTASVIVDLFDGYDRA